MSSNGYIVKDYTDVDDVKTQEPKVWFVPELNIFDVLTEIREKNLKVAVFELGKCVIDWS